MCGIAGCLEFGGRSSEAELGESVLRMARAIGHRGPDDSGEWVDAATGIAFGFRRLAIVDLTVAGHQPMLSATGRYVIEFNGEIYNFERIRAELRMAGYDRPFRGHSDTEVILAAIETWGLEAAVKRFIGMFALALWDRELRLLHLVRDRVGVKPLYYGRSGDVFLFGSELKALRAHPAFRGEIRRQSISEFLHYGYVPGPSTIYQGFSKLQPGCILSVSLDPAAEPSRSVYWSAAEVALSGAGSPYKGTEAEAEAELETLLKDAVGLRMIADVPLGVLLSGGVDSSIVAALMQAQSARPVRTFSIGFHERGFDEAAFAAAVAGHLGTDHTELYVTPQEAMSVIPGLARIYDEPFADVSQIPTFLVAAMARRHVTVALSGDGGDELFGGYNRHVSGARIWRAVHAVPHRARVALARGMSFPGPKTWERLAAVTQSWLPLRARFSNPGDKIAKTAEILRARTPEEVYRRLISVWKHSTAVVLGGEAAPDTDGQRAPELAGFTEQMMYLDLVGYMNDDVLVKVDRATMANSLEAREPLLDHRLIEFAWSLPLSMKVRKGRGKWILRRVLSRYVPDRLIDRPKMGFGVPLDQWLRAPLREWADELLEPARVARDGYLDSAAVSAVWHDHLAGRMNSQGRLWAVLMFQAWLAESHRNEPSEVCSSSQGRSDVFQNTGPSH
jgi:asparagine synthase (glutamine-hydrolysing)